MLKFGNVAGAAAPSTIVELIVRVDDEGGRDNHYNYFGDCGV